MLKFVIDEDMPRSTAKILKARSYEVLDVRDYGLRGKSTEIDFNGNLIILEPGKVRIRRK